MLASGAKDNKIRLWTPSGECLAIGDGHSGAVSALAFSRKSSKFLVSGGVDKILKVSIFARVKIYHAMLASGLTLKLEGGTAKGARYLFQ